MPALRTPPLLQPVLLPPLLPLLATQDSPGPPCCAAPPPPPPQGPPAIPCLSCDDKDAGKPVSVTLTYDCAGAPPATVSLKKGKDATVNYDAAAGVIAVTTTKDKLGSQIDFTYDGVLNSLHTSCSAPFGVGVRTFTDDEEKSCQGGCEDEPPCTGCFVVTAAQSEGGAPYCDLDCADF